MRISALQESIEVKVIDHVIYLGLFDETSDEPAYEFRLEPGALQLVEQIMNAVEKVLPDSYDTPVEPPAGLYSSAALDALKDYYHKHPPFSFSSIMRAEPFSGDELRTALSGVFDTEEPTRPTLTTYPVDGLFDDEDEDAS